MYLRAAQPTASKDIRLWSKPCRMLSWPSLHMQRANSATGFPEISKCATIFPPFVQVLEFMEGGDLRQALSSSDSQRYRWSNLGQHVAMDVVRGLHFLHRNKARPPLSLRVCRDAKHASERLTKMWYRSCTRT